jgi:hypothetical protein
MSMNNSSADMLALVGETQRRIVSVCGKLVKRNGGELNIPDLVHNQMLVARTLHSRYIKGDYRHEPREAMQIKELTDWLVRQHRGMNGGNIESTYEFNPQELSTATPLPAGAYRDVCQHLASRGLSS